MKLRLFHIPHMAVYVPFSAWCVKSDSGPEYCGFCVRVGWHYVSAQLHSDAYAQTYAGAAH